jgi:hypothetical protein
MDELVVREQPQEFSIVPVAQLKARIDAIHRLVESAMQEHVHYGSVTGEGGKKSLWKPGAEQICAMFRIAVRYETEDLSRGDVIHYRVKCIGYSVAGELLGEGMGEASTAEEKYRWRAAICDEEYDNTPETHRRIKYNRGKQGSFYTKKQIKTEAADSANTILKMAAKRAHVAMTLTVAGCSDFFSQDLDDDDTPAAQAGDDEPPPPRQPQRRSQAPAPGPTGAASQEKQPPDMRGERAFIQRKLTETGKDLAPLLAEAGMASLDDLTPDNFLVLKKLLG